MRKALAARLAKGYKLTILHRGIVQDGQPFRFKLQMVKMIILF